MKYNQNTLAEALFELHKYFNIVPSAFAYEYRDSLEAVVYLHKTEVSRENIDKMTEALKAKFSEFNQRVEETKTTIRIVMVSLKK